MNSLDSPNNIERPLLYTLPSAQTFAAELRRRGRQMALLAFVLSVCCGFAFVALGLDSPVLPAVLLILLVTPIVIWHSTRSALYIVFAAACLFEMNSTSYADALTDRVPFFWNVNTIFQVYAHVNFKALPLSFMELLLIVAGATSLVRAVVMNQVSLRGGRVLIPMAIYIGFVLLGWVNGILSGGDSKLALQEVRAQFHFFGAYLMAVNLLRERHHVRVLLWTMVLSIGLKGILYTFRRYVTLGAAVPVPDQGVGSHEEAFLFDAFLVLLAGLGLCAAQKRLRPLMWLLMPLVITGNLATNRRAATAAMIVVVPVVLLAAYRALPDRRRTVAAFGAIISVGFSIYYPAFKNNDSMFAQPARAIASEFEPKPRDLSSNTYRDAENDCLMATIRVSPIQGYGYGRRMIHAVPIADISKQYEWWDLLPHNQVLWVWMRVGTLGFWSFWFMISSIIVYVGRVIRSPRADAETKAVGIFTLATVSMLMIFGLLDLQMSNIRDMLFVGFWIGAVAALDYQNGLTGLTPEGAAEEAKTTL